MAILGESFKPYVRNQINIRQDKLSLRDRDDEILKYITSKTSFLRLTSGIDISPEVAQNLGVINLNGSELAKKYILFSSKFNKNLTSNLGYSPEGFGNNFDVSYGFNSDPNYGLVPPPGLLSATINTLNRGTIREATINLVCHNLYQFKIINILFLKLKYSLLLEWGHTLYFNNDNRLVTSIEIPDLSGDFIKGISSDQILNKIEEQRDESCGNYDAFFGVVKNFDWELTENGSYNVTIKAISQGSVIESLKVNTNLTPNSTAPTNTTDENLYKKSTLHYILGWIVKKLNDSGTLNGYKETADSNALDTDTLASITGVQSGWKDPNDNQVTNTSNNILTYREGIKVDFPNLQVNTTNNQGQPQYYIKLGTLLRIVESFVLHYDLSKKTENGSHPSIFYLDHDFYTNECATIPRHISVDPLTCIIPFDFANSSELNKTVYSTFNSSIVNYTFVTDANGNIISESSTPGVTETDVYNNPNQAILDILQGSQVVTGTNVTFSNGTVGALTLVTPNQSTLQDTIVLIQQNASSLKSSTINVTTQTITKTTKYSVNNETQTGVLENVEDSFRTGLDTPNIGLTMHIYVNINKIIEALDRNIDDDGNVSVHSFLTALLSDIKYALGSINKFDLNYDSITNKFSVIDSAVIPIKYQSLNKDTVARFNINLLKDSNNGGGSFVTNFSLKSEVFSKVANAIAIGAQNNGNAMIANSTPLSNFNTGLTDRIITEKQNPNVSGSKTDQGFDQFNSAYSAYEDFKNKLVSREGGISASDIDLYRSFLTDLFNYDLGTYTNNGHIPGTGFIPLNLQLTMDGLSGIIQYQSFNVDETSLPDEYKDKLGFITTTVTHKIDTTGWETTIGSLAVPKLNKEKTDIVTAPPPEVKKENNKTVDISNTPSAAEGGAYKINNQRAFKTEYWKMGVHHSSTTTGNVSTPGGEWKVSYRKSNYVGFYSSADNYDIISKKNTDKNYVVFDFTLFRQDSSDVDIPAPFDGTVISQGKDSKGNTYMALLGNDGVKTALILHMRAVYKKKGDTFVKGEKIAIQASVGPTSSGVHTHVELMSVEDFIDWWNEIISLPDSYTGLSTNEPINVA